MSLLDLFVPERMHEVNLFVLTGDLEAVTEELARLGALHLQEAQPEAWAPSAAWAEISDQAQALEQRLEQLLVTLDLAVEFVPPEGPLRPDRDLPELEAETRMLEARIEDWRERRAAAERRVQRLTLACPQVEALEPLAVPVEMLRELRHMHLVVGTLPTTNLPRIREALFQISYVLTPIAAEGDRSLVLAAASHDDAAVLDRALASAFFEAIELPAEVRGAPESALAGLRSQLDAAREELAGVAREREALVDGLGSRLRVLWLQATGDAQLADAMRRFARHGEVYLISGWVPASRLGQLAASVKAAARDQVVVESLPPSRGRRDVPTHLRGPRWLRPFEPLVAIFGLPAYDELNPTLFAALAFLLMYGMMFGDLGHGLLLGLLGLALLRRQRSLGVLVAAAGASGALFGLAYGTAFGAELFAPLWLRPMEEITSLLIAAVAGGVVILNLGFLLHLASAWRVRDWPGLLLGKSGLLGIALYWTLLGGGLAVFTGRLAAAPWLLLLAVLALLSWLREPLLQRLERRPGQAAEPLGEALVTGFFELFEGLIGYASNSLSFVRLGAFAVAHEGLSRVLLDSAGGPAGWLVVPLGTALIVGFEGLIVGIQTLRLEYYEFFGRFFKGTGTPFAPLTLGGAGRRSG